MDANFLKFLSILLRIRVILIDLSLVQLNELVSRLFPVNGYPLIVKQCVLEIDLRILAFADAACVSLDNLNVPDDSEQVLDHVFLNLVQEKL